MTACKRLGAGQHSTRIFGVAALGCALVPCLAQDPDRSADAFAIEFASVSPAGVPGDGTGRDVGISGNGRFLLFVSDATNLVPGDTNNTRDLFLRDRLLFKTTRVNLNYFNLQAFGGASTPKLSYDGRYAAFTSGSAFLVLGDSLPHPDVFVRDLQLSVNVRVSVGSAGQQLNAGSSLVAFSSDGRYVAFATNATNVMPSDVNGSSDIFVRDIVAGTIVNASLDSFGNQTLGAGFGSTGGISANGQSLAFTSTSNALVPGDTNFGHDVFVRDLFNGTTRRVSVSSAGVEGDLPSEDCDISDDGRYVVFKSAANTLVPNDTGNTTDVFYHDMFYARTYRVPVSTPGQASGGINPRISRDGRVIAFTTSSPGVVPGDTNSYSDLFLYDRPNRRVRRANYTWNGSQFSADVRPEIALDATGSIAVCMSDALGVFPNVQSGSSGFQVYSIRSDWVQDPREGGNPKR